MIKTLCYFVEYGLGTFGPEYDVDSMKKPIRFLQQNPDGLEPALSVHLFKNRWSGGRLQGTLEVLGFTVLVHDSDHAESDVLKFLERFEETFPAPINLQFRTVT